MMVDSRLDSSDLKKRALLLRPWPLSISPAPNLSAKEQQILKTFPPPHPHPCQNVSTVRSKLCSENPTPRYFSQHRVAKSSIGS